MEFEDFARRREGWIKQLRSERMKREVDKLTPAEREDLEQVMQMYADKYGGVVTFVTKNKKQRTLLFYSN